MSYVETWKSRTHLHFELRSVLKVWWTIFAVSDIDIYRNKNPKHYSRKNIVPHFSPVAHKCAHISTSRGSYNVNACEWMHRWLALTGKYMMKNNFFVFTKNNIVNLEMLKRTTFIVISHQRRCLCLRCLHNIFDKFFFRFVFWWLFWWCWIGANM